MNYSKLSLSLTEKIDKNTKKNNGIYFTPINIIKDNLNYIKPYIKDIKDVLEPSCGSCEYILEINKQFDNLNITGLENNNIIYNKIKKYSKDNIIIEKQDFLEYKTDNKYDLIIGNPPFFVIKKDKISYEYYKYFDGRPNIFIIFIVKSLELLNDNGILSFILPKNFLNCLYYNKLREYINNNFEILNIINCENKFIETQQETFIFIVKKNIIPNINKRFILEINNLTIFGSEDNIHKLKELYNNSTTLSLLNLSVSVGKIVWNQCKKLLTDDSTKTLLIYSSDIKNNQLDIQEYKNKEKKNYIDVKGNNYPLLVVNRGYGVGKYKFQYCLINQEKDYLIENHLICINNKNYKKNKLIELYEKIIKSFENKKTKRFIKLYFGNNAINTRELCYILPIY